MQRLSRKQIEKLARMRVEQNGFEYGYGLYHIQLAYTDARCAPYLYALELQINPGGGVTQLIGASTARQMWDRLYHSTDWVTTAQRQIAYHQTGEYPS